MRIVHRGRNRLREGDRKEVGAAGSVADAVLGSPHLIDALIVLIEDEDPGVAAHAVHAAMQIGARRPALFDPHADRLIAMLDRMKQWEIGEQLPKILTRSKLSDDQVRLFHEILLRNIENRSNIVAACSLQAIVDLAAEGRIEKHDGRAALDKALASERKALSARARKLDRAAASLRR